MQIPLIVRAGLVMLAGLPLASYAPAAAAQDTRPGNAASMDGPVVAGVCLLSREAVFTHAAAGKDATAQVQKMMADAQAAATRDQTRLDAEVERLGLRKPGVQADRLNAEQTKLTQELKAAQDKATQRSRDLESMRAKAIEAISTAAQPLIAQTYTRRGCGLLLDRNAVLAGNMSNDITADVVKALDATLTTLKVQP